MGACSPRKYLSFIPSEIISSVFSDSVLYSVLSLYTNNNKINLISKGG